MAAQTQTADWRGKQYRSSSSGMTVSVSACQPHRQEEEHGPSDSELYQ